MSTSGKLIIFAAPSGAGKTTIVNKVKQRIGNLEFSVSACSRSPRTGETDGKDYYFLSPEDFMKKVEKNEFVEWEQVYEGKYYGTLRSEIEKKWSEGKHILFDVDVVGALNLKKQFAEQALTIFVMPPSIEALHQRLINRGTETPETLAQRISKATEEMSYSDRFDTIILNDTLEVAVEKAYTTVKQFIEKTANND